MVVGQGGAVPHHQPKYPLFAPPSKSLPHHQNFEKSIKHKPYLRFLTSIFQKFRLRRLIQFVPFLKQPKMKKWLLLLYGRVGIVDYILSLNRVYGRFLAPILSKRQKDDILLDINGQNCNKTVEKRLNGG